jgi:ubiquinone/menaquinone biosynthesis C-methylase UbiE
MTGTHILELGHGPGHLQRFLLDFNLILFAIDESTQMGFLAKKRIGSATQKLTRGLAQHLPYKNESFDCVISTFPTDYIFNQETLSEVKRCLRASGRLVVLPAAFPKSGFLKWLYKVTGENPGELNQSIQNQLIKPFVQAGFETEIKFIEVKSSSLIILVGSINR